MRFFTLLTAAVSLVLLATAPARADERSDALATVAKATSTVQHLQADEHFPEYWQPSLARARGVLIVPSFYKAGFIVGGAYGNGVLMVRNDSGVFSPPAFYRMTAGSLGLQIGAEEREIMYMIMTDKGLQAIMEDRFKVGAGVNLAIVTWGGGAEAATTSAAGADIVAFSHAAGAYGGGVIEGAGIEPRPDWNRALYGANANSKSIVFDRRYTLEAANALIAALDTASNFHPANGTPAASSSYNTTPASNSSSYSNSQPVSQSSSMSGSSASGSTSGRSSMDVQELDSPGTTVQSSSSSVKSSGSSSTGSTPVKLVPQQGSTLQ